MHQMGIRPYFFWMGFFKLFGLTVAVLVSFIMVVKFPDSSSRILFVVSILMGLASMYFGLMIDYAPASLLFYIFAAIGLGIVTGQDITTNGYTDPIRVAIVLWELVLVFWIWGLIFPSHIMTWKIYIIMAVVLAFQIGVTDFSSEILTILGLAPQRMSNWGLMGAGVLLFLATTIYKRNANEIRTLDCSVDGGIIMLVHYFIHRMTTYSRATFRVEKRDVRKR